MLSRHGEKIKAPDWFVETYSSEFTLDGELWVERATMELLNGILQSNEDTGWKKIKYMVFDLPSSNDLYEIRSRQLARIQFPKHTVPVNIERCRGTTHLQLCLLDIVKTGGEGLMINKSKSIYVGTRTNTLLKIKVSSLL